MSEARVGIDFAKLPEASALVQELTGVKLDILKLVGVNAYAREVGLGID